MLSTSSIPSKRFSFVTVLWTGLGSSFGFRDSRICPCCSCILARPSVRRLVVRVRASMAVLTLSSGFAAGGAPSPGTMTTSSSATFGLLQEFVKFFHLPHLLETRSTVPLNGFQKLMVHSLHHAHTDSSPVMKLYLDSLIWTKSNYTAGNGILGHIPPSAKLAILPFSRQ